MVAAGACRNVPGDMAVASGERAAVASRRATGGLRTHAVIAALLLRRAESSLPGARSDGLRIALAVEGGAMRGVVSAGMLSALEQLGLLAAFDDVYGASAGAVNAAFFLAGQAAYGAALYHENPAGGRFISIARALRGGVAVDMDYVIDRVYTEQRRLRFDAILASGVRLHLTATDVDSGELVDLCGLDTAEEIRGALRASTRLPRLAGPPVRFRGRRLLDPTLSESIPVSGPFGQDATHVLVLQTRPYGVAHSKPSRAIAALTDRYLERLNPRLVDLHRTRSQRYDALSASLAARSSDASARPSVCVIQPPAGGVLVSHLERRRQVLRAAAAEGLRTGWRALTGEGPEVVATLRAFPRAAGG